MNTHILCTKRSRGGLTKLTAIATLLLGFGISQSALAGIITTQGSIGPEPTLNPLHVNDEFFIGLTLNNDSSDSDLGPLAARFNAGAVLTVKLACNDGLCFSPRPGTLQFLPQGGTGCAAGANLASCALDPTDPTGNTVLVTLANTIEVGPSGSVDAGSIKVKAINPINPTPGNPTSQFFVLAASLDGKFESCTPDLTSPICSPGTAVGTSLLNFPPECGDGILGNTPGETCEPPGSPVGSPGETCREDCTFCGDGIVNPGEQCDDGNETNGDGCENTCVPTPICGDGILGNTPGEKCEPPGSPVGSPGETCRQDCTFCGDGVVDAGEQCDDGNEINGDGCENTCVPTPICGDGILGNTPGEKCEPPGSPVGSPGETCRQDCTFCGDGVVNNGEQCDDGNETNGDGCSATCENEREEICRTPGYWGTHAGAEKSNSQNITLAVIDAAEGSLEVCGKTIDNTNVENAFSAVEGICVSVQGTKSLQLARQLTAADLNCVISGSEDCVGLSIEDEYANCNDVCQGIPVEGYSVTSCIGKIDCFNNGGTWQGGSCNYELATGCHERAIPFTDLGLDPKKVAAGSSDACNKATKSDCTILSPDKCDVH